VLCESECRGLLGELVWTQGDMHSGNRKYEIRARVDARSAGRFSIQNVVGGGALSVIALACAGTLAANLFGAGINPVLASANVGAVVGVEQPSFADRFGPVLSNTSKTTSAAPVASPAAATVVAKKPNNFAALMDPSRSMGGAPSTFQQRMDALERPSVASAAPQQPAPVQQASLAPAAAQPALSVPLPPLRSAAIKPAKNVELARNAEPSLREIAQASKAMAVANAAQPKPTIFDKLFGRAKPTVLAYAAPDGGIGSDGGDTVKSGLYDRTTAVYDISAHTVYLPDGTKLEAHSGLGSRLDDPRYAHERMRGVTPPHIYDLKPREALFHGVPALRLNPVGGESAIYGRSGLLAHTYMLGPNGDSNGCVSFKDYNKFLQAYRNGDVKRLVVVAKVD
jgi:hypothetical protein